jgi:hypothetical protein
MDVNEDLKDINNSEGDSSTEKQHYEEEQTNKKEEQKEEKKEINQETTEEEKEDNKQATILEVEQENSIVQKEKYIEKNIEVAIENFEEEKQLFSTTHFSFNLKEYDIEYDVFEKCKENLQENLYSVITDKSDLVSKYFADRLCQSIDPYGKKVRLELRFEFKNIEYSKIDFVDLLNFIETDMQNSFVIVDMCKFGHLEKEFFLNSFYDFVNIDGNRIKLREKLANKNVTVLFLAYKNDIDVANNINHFPVQHSSDTLSQNATVQDISIDEYSDTELVVLFVLSIFRKITLNELQELLRLYFDEDEILYWQQNRRSIFKKLDLATKSIPEVGSVVYLGGLFEDREDELIEILHSNDPFFISELFEMFDSDGELLKATLEDDKSVGFTNGFFLLVKLTTQNDVARLSLNWFIQKFNNNSSINATYLFSLSSCALQISSALNDNRFLDDLASELLNNNELWILYYFVEYIGYMDYIDRFQWYKQLLSRLGNEKDDKKLRNHIYNSIKKSTQEDICRLKSIIAWSNSKGVLGYHSDYILLKLASESLKYHKNWQISDDKIPFIFDCEESVFSNCTQEYIKYIYHITNRDIADSIIQENINRLFFSKYLGLSQYYGFYSQDNKKIINSLLNDIYKVLNNDKLLLIVLLIIEWHYVLRNKTSLNYDIYIFTLLNQSLKKDDLRQVKTLLLDLSSLLLKLSSNYRKNKELQQTYIQLRKISKDIQLQITKNS